MLNLLNGKITEFEGNTEKIKILQQEAEKLALDKEEFNKQHGVKYPEKGKDQLLEEQKFEAEKFFLNKRVCWKKQNLA